MIIENPLKKVPNYPSHRYISSFLTFLEAESHFCPFQQQFCKISVEKKVKTHEFIFNILTAFIHYP